MKTVTVIIPSYRRRENLKLFIERIKEFSYPIERLMIWDNNYNKNDPLFIEDDELDVEVINSSTNRWGSYAAHTLGGLTNSDYILLCDDDRLPGPKSVEYLIKLQEDYPGLYVDRGVILKSERSYMPNERIKSKPEGKEPLQVDMGGGVYFYPNDITRCYFSELPPVFIAISDIHLSYVAQKYGNYKVYVPFPPEEEMCFRYKNDLLIKTDGGEEASWRQNYHYMNRDGYVRWAVRNGWKLLNFNNKEDK